ELLRHERRGTACCWHRCAGVGCRWWARQGETEAHARDPAGERIPARSRSILVFGLRALEIESVCHQRTERLVYERQPHRSERVHADAVRQQAAQELVA